MLFGSGNHSAATVYYTRAQWVHAIHSVFSFSLEPSTALNGLSTSIVHAACGQPAILGLIVRWCHGLALPELVWDICKVAWQWWLVRKTFLGHTFGGTLDGVSSAPCFFSAEVKCSSACVRPSESATLGLTSSDSRSCRGTPVFRGRCPGLGLGLG